MINKDLGDRAWRSTLEKVFTPSLPSASPVLLSIGAQPGAGKTKALGASLRNFYPNQDFVQIIGDDFRRYHPDYEKLCAHADPEVMPRQTAELSGWLVGRALEYAAEHGYCTVVEGTLRRSETTLRTIRQFADAGASTHLVVLGVNPAESWTGCVGRYLTALKEGTAARWTPLEAHNAGLTGTPETLRAAETDLSVHRISVVDRTAVLHYDNSRGPDGAWLTPTGAVAALEELRARPANPRALAEQLQELAKLAAHLGVPKTVTAGLKHAHDLSQGKPAALTHTDVLEAVRGRAHNLSSPPHAHGPTRRNHRAL